MSKISRNLAAFAAIAMAAGLGQGAALARSSTFTRTFSTPRGTFTENATRSYNPSNGVASETATETGPYGRTATVTATSTPDGRGGFTNTRSVTNFRDQTTTTTHQIGR